MDAVGELLGKCENVFLTCDIPKLHIVPDSSVYDFMERNKGYIREAHLHDSSKAFGRHQCIGEGDVEFSVYKDFFLREDIYCNFEIRPKESALSSMKKWKSDYCH